MERVLPQMFVFVGLRVLGYPFWESNVQGVLY